MLKAIDKLEKKFEDREFTPSLFKRKLFTMVLDTVGNKKNRDRGRKNLLKGFGGVLLVFCGTWLPGSSTGVFLSLLWIAITITGFLLLGITGFEWETLKGWPKRFPKWEVWG